MMYNNKNADTLLLLLLFTMGQCEKNTDKAFVSADVQKRWKTAGSGSTLPQYIPNPKSKFPVNFIFTMYCSVLSYFQLTKKPQRFH